MKQNIVAALITLTAASGAMAATPVDLNNQTISTFATFMPSRLAAGVAAASVQETSRSVDFNQTTHIRVMQTYAGYPVWGSDAVVHVPKGVTPDLTQLSNQRMANRVSMNGIFYRNLQADLHQAPATVTNKDQLVKAEQAAVDLYTKQFGKPANVTRMQSEIIVYLDDKSVAHWAYKVRFMTNEHHGMPSMPLYILDAATLATLDTWNDLKTAMEIVNGGGIGGNPTMGKKTYDGLTGDRPILKFSRDAASKTCYLQNNTVTVIDVRDDKTPAFMCETPDAQHNNVYWNTLNDEYNGGYSPDNDAVYSDSIVREMYMNWFKVNMLQKNGKPQHVIFNVHDDSQGQNAFYENGQMTFGEGDNESYPVVAPSVVAHEMSHAFTEQHSNLAYTKQSGGLNESFSDMADKATEYYMYGENNWNIDPELLKTGGRLLRYMDEPTKDCEDGAKPGQGCSIDNMKDYNDRVEVHFSSGIFNKAFTIISGSPNWNTHKAFEVMTQANMNYWTKTTTFSAAACGVVKAARDYKYDEATIKNAMSQVGVVIGKC